NTRSKRDWSSDVCSSDLRKAYRETLTALDYIKTDDEENIIFIGDVEKTASKTQFLDEIDEGSLLLAIKTNDISFVKNTLENFLDDKYYDDIGRASCRKIV